MLRPPNPGLPDRSNRDARGRTRGSVDRTDPNAKDDVTDINNIHVVVDRPVLVHLTSKDVIHSFGLNEMRVKQDAVPGLEMPVWFIPTITTDQDAWDKTFAPGKGGVEMLDGFLAGIDAGTPWETAALKELTEKVGEANGLKLGKAQAPLRVAVTGKTVGLPMFESLEALGAPVSLARLRAARAKLG